MEREHLDSVLAEAREQLDLWLAQNDRLCDLKRSDFHQGYPYGESHMQALYVLRYYPAYFAENYMLYERLKTEGLTDPVVESIGCGCLVDCAAGQFVYGDDFLYTGYDTVDWGIKAVEIDGVSIEFRCCNVADVDHFYPNANVFIFPRSVGDIGSGIARIRDVLEATELTESIIYVCATYRVTAAGIGYDMGRLREFAAMFRDYRMTELCFFNGAEDAHIYIDGKYGWFTSPDDYCRNLLANCSQPEDNCPKDDCNRNVAKWPMKKMEHLSYEILKLERL